MHDDHNDDHNDDDDDDDDDAFLLARNRLEAPSLNRISDIWQYFCCWSAAEIEMDKKKKCEVVCLLSV